MPQFLSLPGTAYDQTCVIASANDDGNDHGNIDFEYYCGAVATPPALGPPRNKKGK